MRVFTLEPQAPHLCVLDFAVNLIEDSIERGYQDAKGERQGPAATGNRRFKEDLGRPVFKSVGRRD